MKTIGLVGSVEIGPWRLPQKAQTCLIHDCARRNGLVISYVESEYVLDSESYPNLVRTASKADVENVVFTSLFQLPEQAERLHGLLDVLEDKNLYFALEDAIMTRGKEGSEWIGQLEMFRKARYLSRTSVGGNR